MATKSKPLPPPVPFPDPIAELLSSVPVTRADYLAHIRALRRRVVEHVRFICAVGSLDGTSVEAKDLAVVLFYERLAAAERHLAHVKQNLELG
jgi:hypothetical protein